MPNFGWMEDSSICQAVLHEGTIRGARNILFSVGNEQLGSPSLATRLAVERIEDFGRLKAMIRQSFSVSSWDELLAIDLPPESESPEYRAILMAGKLEAARELLVAAGTRQFDQPPPAMKRVVDSIHDFDRLRRLLEHLPDASNWEDLMDRVNVPEID